MENLLAKIEFDTAETEPPKISQNLHTAFLHRQASAGRDVLSAALSPPGEAASPAQGGPPGGWEDLAEPEAAGWEDLGEAGSGASPETVFLVVF